MTPASRLVAAVLERWGLPPRRLGDLAELERLLAVWLDHVPFENLTKLIRAGSARTPAGGRRGPRLFWKEHLELSAGGTCFAATGAFRFLLAGRGLCATLEDVGEPRATALAAAFGLPETLVTHGLDILRAAPADTLRPCAR